MQKRQTFQERASGPAKKEFNLDYSKSCLDGQWGASTMNRGTIRTCMVCNEVIKKHTCIHYGGLSCYSCRAFFRRSVTTQLRSKEAAGEMAATQFPQVNKAKVSPLYVCKFHGSCEINVATRKRCQSCRFMKCLAIGMKPDQVLTEDQKKERFSRRKDQVLVKTVVSSAESEELDVLDEFLGNEGFSNHSSNVDNDIKPNVAIKVEPNIKSEGVESEAMSQTSFQLWNGLGKVGIKDSLEALRAARYEVFFSEAALIRKFFDFHMNLYSLQKWELDKILRLTLEVFVRFFNKSVSALMYNFDQDRIVLAQENRFTYLNFVLARYFSSTTSEAQMETILGSVLLRDFFPFSQKCPIPPVPFQNYIFLEQGNVRQLTAYQELFNEFRRCVNDFSADAIEAIALLLPYRTPEYLLLNNKTFIESQFERNKEMICQEFKVQAKALDKALDLCDNMTEIFRSCFIWTNDWNCYSSVKAQPTMPFTMEEELWMDRILGQFNSIYQSVPLDERLCQEFFKFSRGGSLTPQFMMDTSLLTCERLKRAMAMHSDFGSLHHSIQEAAFAEGVGKANAMMMLSLETLPSGMDQFRFMYGPLDDGIMHMLLAVGELKKLSCSDVTIGDDVAGPPPSPSLTNDMKEYKVTSQIIAHAAKNTTILKMVILLALTSHSSLIRHHLEYIKLLERAAQTHRDHDLFNSVFSVLSVIDKILNILKVMFSV